MSSNYAHYTTSIRQPRSTGSSHSSHLSNNSSESSLHSHLNSITSPGLPSEEYRTLRRRQERARLESHFTHRDRVRISQVKNATRHALGSSFDFTDESYERSTAATATPRRAVGKRRECGKYEDPIPPRYIDEFNNMWADDDDVYDAEQVRADMSYAPWRVHARMPRDVAPVEPCAYPNRVSRVDSAIAGVEARRETRSVEEVRPQLVSKFSTDSLPAAKGMRSIFGRRR
ncbi:hypothetical protein NX059_008646 [Plenodomus lindquistii]|nr:hypothetical protein NX059_008646 [Plenodomus lindquistii]